ncbi:LytTR family transcriptional regulator DNA-binding domain-containing protein [Sphingomonas sp. M1-B02]|uniref:LytTR family transcriptional regulator DNA-binding domain-containing protein n=1 Tax=Sphingomonas sp. M1-B02 TaxID=3114300 RepID=UPI00223F2A08|nr:LytTR family transcriptional regulator DNA-binding domain-containing protein [Sphingomonas sp. S6-11]UZK64843.1 LytTR family transcriptional regulator DNA-binding domain-containing protein [Sphingomonas sp. S6-11]
MLFARTASPDRREAAPGKSGFANRAGDFAKRVRLDRAPPGFPILWIACAAAAGLMIVTGGFRTGELPLAQRALFWILLMGWNAAKWQSWFLLTVRKPADWPRASLLGTLLLNLPLPLEIGLCGRLVGLSMRAGPWETWGRALAISFLIVAVAGLVSWTVLRRAGSQEKGEVEDGLLARARILPDSLASIQAEDHYCRVRGRDGETALVHYRFGDALAEVAGINGARVHRGAWVAAQAVLGARRQGRRWRLLLADGSDLAVSATYLGEARRRGWLHPPPRRMN